MNKKNFAVKNEYENTKAEIKNIESNKKRRN